MLSDVLIIICYCYAISYTSTLNTKTVTQRSCCCCYIVTKVVHTFVCNFIILKFFIVSSILLSLSTVHHINALMHDCFYISCISTHSHFIVYIVSITFSTYFVSNVLTNVKWRLPLWGNKEAYLQYIEIFQHRYGAPSLVISQ